MTTQTVLNEAVHNDLSAYADAVNSLPTTAAKKEAATAVLETLDEKAAKDVARKFALPPPPNGIWYLIITGLLAMALVFGWISFSLIDNGKSAEAIIGLATAALGGVIGLIAPSPVSKA